MTIDTIASKPCSRCAGTGRHSFNLRDLDVCYGCGGSGRVPMIPKGQKAIKPTADLKNCKVGDIVKAQGVLYRIDRIQWCEPKMTRGNQRIRAIRLVDGKAFFLWRAATEESTQGYGCTMDTSGNKVYFVGAAWIPVTPEMVGQDTDVSHIPMTEAERAMWLHYVSERTGLPVEQIKVMNWR